MEDILDPVSISVSKSSVRMTMEKLWHRPRLAMHDCAVQCIKTFDIWCGVHTMPGCAVTMHAVQ